jgi:hypothetical protein
VELNVDTWLGPDAGEEVREEVRGMQRHAFEVQLASPKGAGRNEAEIDLSAIKAPCLALSGGHDLADFGRSRPNCRVCSPTRGTSNCPGPVISPREPWSCSSSCGLIRSSHPTEAAVTSRVPRREYGVRAKEAEAEPVR